MTAGISPGFGGTISFNAVGQSGAGYFVQHANGQPHPLMVDLCDYDTLIELGFAVVTNPATAPAVTAQGA